MKIVAQNRSASYNYHLLDKLEAGLVLVGTEVKSLREGKGTLARGLRGDSSRRGMADQQPHSRSTSRAAREITIRSENESCC